MRLTTPTAVGETTVKPCVLGQLCNQVAASTLELLRDAVAMGRFLEQN